MMHSIDWIREKFKDKIVNDNITIREFTEGKMQHRLGVQCEDFNKLFGTEIDEIMADKNKDIYLTLRKKSVDNNLGYEEHLFKWFDEGLL